MANKLDRFTASALDALLQAKEVALRMQHGKA